MTIAKSKVVVVTGAGSGIGRAVALAFASTGSTVVCADISMETALATAELCESRGGHGLPYRVDVADTELMAGFAKWVESEAGVPEVVVNNAGIGMAGSFLDTTTEDWEAILGVNLGVIQGCRLFARMMVDRGEGGHIVNTASAAAFTPSRHYSAYATTKAAVLMLSECLRTELAPTGIGVTAICPGFADTGIAMATRYVGSTATEEDSMRRRADRLYRRRHLTPEKVAAAVVAAVERNQAVRPVGAEARITRTLYRLSPGLVRKAGSLDVLNAGKAKKGAK